MKSTSIFFCFLVSFCLLSTGIHGQSKLFKFNILKEGIYKITPAQLQQIGAKSLDEVAIFGFQGMLPQRLDSAQLDLQEIAGLEKDGNLYYFLSGPNQMTRDSEGKLIYLHHLYADSLSFLIGIKSKTKRIESSKLKVGNQSSKILYRYQNIKEEEENLLNSGRTWYSKPINSGSLKGYDIRAKTNSKVPWRLTGTIIGRSAILSEISLRADNLEIFKSPINPIIANTYALKGREIELDIEFSPIGSKLDRLVISFQSADSNGRSYLDHLSIGVPFSSLDLSEGVYFSDPNQFSSLSIKSNLEAWDVTDFHQPLVLDFTEGNQSNSEKIIVFNPIQIPSLPQIFPAENQIRDRKSWPSLLIIAPKSLKFSAQKLKKHKISKGLHAEVVLVEDIYDAFGYGNQDLNAIRNLIAWHFHRGKKLQNVLVLGKGTFDYKKKLGGRPNLVPIYTSRNSLNPLTTFSSDDYFGLIQWGQGEWVETNDGDEKMQIGVGRIPVITTQEALIVVDKIIQYENNLMLGTWKNTVALLADDGDNGIHLRDSELHASYLLENYPELIQKKLYLDRFEQSKNVSSQSSPQAKIKLEETLQEGALLLNYIGHGNETTLTAEEVFKVSDIANWADQKKLAVWITATCEFGRHDSPFLRSAAEELLIAPNKGAIGLLTTGRPVFSSVNFQLNEAFFRQVFSQPGGQNQDLGTIFRNTKNGSLNGSLNRSFSLLGDPSMRLSGTDYKIKITSIQDTKNSEDLEIVASLQEVDFSAEVISPLTGLIARDFFGEYDIELRGNPITVQTLGNESAPMEFEEEPHAIFRGKGIVESGLIKGQLLIPPQINQDLGLGKLRIIALSKNKKDAFGMKHLLIGGTIDHFPLDTIGPQIKIMIDSTTEEPFLTPATRVLLTANLEDPSGINISYSNTDEILSVRVNQNISIAVNEKFKSKNNSFKQGSFSIQLNGLVEGENLVTVQAFDNKGNRSIHSVIVEVRGSDQFRILDLKNFPNPAETETHFEFTHNRPGENLNARLRVVNLTGQILFDKVYRYVKADPKISGLSWFFLQNQTNYPPKGSYIYTLSLTSEKDNSSASLNGKIVIK